MTIYINGLDKTLAQPVVVTKTSDYTITTADFGKTLRMNSASAYTFTLPSVGSTEDGSRLCISKLGAGKVTIQAADSDLIGNSSAGGTLYNNTAELYAVVNLEYIHAIVTWVIRGAHGSWTTT